jgi:GNAT superfamily N-acetyltransferase
LIISPQSHDRWYYAMTDVLLRSAAEHDLPELSNLYRHLHPQDPELETAAAAHVWSTLLASGFMTVIVAQAAERLVSSCTLAIVPNLTRGGRSYGVIENVVTHAEYRRLGLGQRVLARALEIAWQADCYKVLLATGSKRETTLRFYERAGFERGGKTYFEVRRP